MPDDDFSTLDSVARGEMGEPVKSRRNSPIDDAIKASKPIRLPPTAHAVLKTCIEHMGMVLEGMGIDWKPSPSTVRTPERFVRYLQEFMQPFSIEEIMGDGFDHSTNDVSIHGLVAQGRIPYVAICEHHLLPFYGEAYIGYIPNDRVVGLSKMARLVHAVGHEKPGLQEAQTEMIADAMFNTLKSKGSIVVIKATHTCMSCRGIQAQGAITTTSCIRGVFRDVSSAREEFLSLMGLGR